MAQRSAGDATQSRAVTSPGVRIPPPVVYAAALAVGGLLQKMLPLTTIPSAMTRWIGIPVAICGVALAGWSVATMVSGHGTLNTDGPSKALVERGPYRLSRNPMYLALALMYTGAVVALNLPWGLALVPLLLIYTQTLVIAREEAYLTSAFGQSYIAYMARVRRWL